MYQRIKFFKHAKLLRKHVKAGRIGILPAKLALFGTFAYVISASLWRETHGLTNINLTLGSRQVLGRETHVLFSWRWRGAVAGFRLARWWGEKFLNGRGFVQFRGKGLAQLVHFDTPQMRNDLLLQVSESAAIHLRFILIVKLLRLPFANRRRFRIYFSVE